MNINKNPKEHEKVNNKAISMLFLAVVVDLLGFGLVLPLLPFWTTQIIGTSEIMYGILLASYSLFQFIFAPIWGTISDRVGRRPIILIGLSGSIISYFMLFFGAFFFITSLEILFLARILQGIFTSATLPTSQAYISDKTPPGADRTKNFALIGAAFGIGFAIGPALGGVLTVIAEIIFIDKKGYWAPALFATILAIINLIGAIKWLPESLSREDIANNTIKDSNSIFQNLKMILKSKNILVLMIIFSVVSLTFSISFSTSILLGEVVFKMNEEQAGYMFFTFGVVMLIIQGKIIGMLTQRFTDLFIMTLGLLITFIAFLTIPFINTFESFILNAIIVATGLALINPTNAALLSKITSKDEQGSILGINQGLASLMRVIGPVSGTYLFTIFIYFPVFFNIIIIIVCILITILMYSSINQISKYYPTS